MASPSPEGRVYYHKLIRDTVPEVMTRRGVVFSVQVLDDELEFLRALQRKVAEEADEVAKANSRSEVVAEVGDLLDVIDELRVEMGITEEELFAARERQWEKKGGFAKRLFLEWSENPRE